MRADKLKVVLCWHMHQPDYRDLATGEYQRPWTYLHAIKDYVDMAAHLEAVPKAKAVVNFAPILLEQLTDYAERIGKFLSTGQPLPDPLLAHLGGAVSAHAIEERLALIDACLRANQQRLIDRFAPYKRLSKLARQAIGDAAILEYLSDEFFADLSVWYHLAWMAETVRRSDPLIAELMKKASGFTLEERRALLALIGTLISSVIPRYRRLAERGQVELSASPFAHPMVPLLIDLNTAAEALADIALPRLGSYPGGEPRASWHLAEGLRVFEHHFGFPARGCWPSEGGVSDATIRLLDSQGIVWAASGEAVLSNSLAKEGRADEADTRHRPYRVAGKGTVCFFRCDELSDDIGFNFKTWHADHAVAHLVHRLESIRDELDAPAERVVAIVLDGENAWESYPENGYHFLSAMYGRLAEHPALELTTFSESLHTGVAPGALDRVVAGSWVYGTFDTWIGHEAKNRASDILIEAKTAFDKHIDALSEPQQVLARAELAVCEGSDWFWWLGDEYRAEAVPSFEQLFRLHVRRLYELLGVPRPEALEHPIADGSGQQAGAMRRSGT